MPLRIPTAVIGLGIMGSGHARMLREKKIPGLRLAAVCDANPAAGQAFPEVPFFQDSKKLFAAGLAQAAIIATPHRFHIPAARAALRAGLHVLIEKPLAAEKGEAERLFRIPASRRQKLAVMFNQRTDPAHREIKRWVDSGKLGPIQRIQWTMTHWFRTEAYYRQGGWRATWAGEGGGVLLNQCPHQLDLLGWWFGPPKRVHGVCRYGRYHRIETEDDVTAFLEYPDGATATLIASTGETPGTNRLEICADRGRVVLEGRNLEFLRNRIPARRYSRTSKVLFSQPKIDRFTKSFPEVGPQHQGILKNFSAAIRQGVPLIAPAREGLGSLELANAILFSSHLGRPVCLPLSSSAYRRFLQSRIRKVRR
jgi:predicted dehydrogenase